MHCTVWLTRSVYNALKEHRFAWQLLDNVSQPRKTSSRLAGDSRCTTAEKVGQQKIETF